MSSYQFCDKVTTFLLSAHSGFPPFENIFYHVCCLKADFSLIASKLKGRCMRVGKGYRFEPLASWAVVIFANYCCGHGLKPQKRLAEGI